MWKFIFKIVFIKKHLDSFLNYWKFENTVDIWSFVWILMKHRTQQIWNIFTKVSWYIWVFSLDDFLSQLMKTLCVEWWHKCTHFIKKNTKGPDVGFEAVRLRLYDLWWQIIWCTNNCLGFRSSFTKNTGYTKITKLNHAFFRKENVLWFEVTMEYLSVMDVFKGQAYLSKPIENVIFAPVLQLSTCFVSYFVFFFDFALKISTIGKIHDDTQFTFFSFIHFAESHNIGVLEHF